VLLDKRSSTAATALAQQWQSNAKLLKIIEVLINIRQFSRFQNGRLSACK